MSNSIVFDLVDGLTVSCNECDPKVAESFVTAFRSTWASLPKVVRHIVGEFLKEQRSEILFEPYQGTSAGDVDPQGKKLRYKSDVFAISREDKPEFSNVIIAHELGHVFFIALGERLHAKQIERFSRESITWHLHTLWGFPITQLWNWLQQDVEFKSGEASRRDVPRITRAQCDELMKRWRAEWGATYRSQDNPTRVDEEVDAFMRETQRFFEVGTMGDEEFEALQDSSLESLRSLVKR